MFPDYDFCCDLFKKYELDLPSEVYGKLEIYADFLVKYNENVNLTAIIDGREIFVKHFLDSILLLKYVDIPSNSSIIDVGTGAGFPSVPMKIYRPDLKITLLDSLNKRINFLQQLCEMTQIDAEFIHGRAEDYGKESQYREKFDFSCARAVANLSVLSEYCIPFVKIGGYFLSMKGPNEIIDESNKAVELLGGKIKSDIQYSLENDTRRIIAIEKISQTPTVYPRNGGKIAKKPL